MDIPNFTFEEWRPVTNYAGIYEVSSLGRVRSIDRAITTKNDHPSAKLTSEKVREIKKMLKQGVSQYKIAYDFGVSRGTIQAIHKGKTWKD